LYESAAHGSQVLACLEKPGAHTQSARVVLSAGETWLGGQLWMRVLVMLVGDEEIV